jgi:hypothetical protein
MKRYLPRFVSALIIVFGLFIFNSVIFAQNPVSLKDFADKNVKAAVEEQFFKNFANSLDSSKKDFSVQGEDSFHKALLGDGIPFYKISTKNGNNDELFIFSGYIFPIKLNGKSTGIVYAINDNGTWKVDHIENDAKFEQNISDANKNLKNGDTSRLIVDPSYEVKALVVQNSDGESLLDINSNSNLKLQKNKAVPISEFKETLKKVKEEKGKISSTNKDGEQQSGSGQLPVKTSSKDWGRLSIILFIIFIISLIPTVYLIRKNRRNLQ